MTRIMVEIVNTVDICTAEGRRQLNAAMAAGLPWRTVPGNGLVKASVPSRRRRRKKTRAVFKIDEAMGGKMHRMRRDGVSLREIARTVGISVSGAGNYLRRTAAEVTA